MTTNETASHMLIEVQVLKSANGSTKVHAMDCRHTGKAEVVATGYREVETMLYAPTKEVADCAHTAAWAAKNKGA